VVRARVRAQIQSIGTSKLLDSPLYSIATLPGKVEQAYKTIEPFDPIMVLEIQYHHLLLRIVHGLSYHVLIVYLA